MDKETVYNISLTTDEVDDVLSCLLEKANKLLALQNKVYNSAMKQKELFEEPKKSKKEKEVLN